MKSSYIIAAMLCVASSAMAQNEKIVVTTSSGKQKAAITETTAGTFETVDGVESLVIDGNTIAPLSEITDIRFIDESTLPFTVTDPKGVIEGAYEAVPSMLRIVPSGDATNHQFAFGTVEATGAAQLAQGDYGIYLSLSASAINAGGIADLSQSQAFILKLYKYEETQAVDSLTSATAGSITYSWNAKRKTLTLNINATFNDGTVLKSEYTGTPTDVESLTEMVPEKTYGNELVVINSSGNASTSYPIESVKKSSVSSYNAARYPGTKFTFSSSTFYGTLSVEFKDEPIIDKGTVDLTSFDSEVFYIRFGSTQVYPAYESTEGSYPYKNHVDNGTIRIDKLGDNEYEIFIDFVNSYSNYMGEGQGNKEHYTLHWKGTVE